MSLVACRWFCTVLNTTLSPQGVKGQLAKGGGGKSTDFASHLLCADLNTTLLQGAIGQVAKFGGGKATELLVHVLYWHEYNSSQGVKGQVAKVGGGKATELLVYVLYWHGYNSFTRGQRSISQEC